MLNTGSTLEAYVASRGWEDASLDECPACGPHPDCTLCRHGTYKREFPIVCLVARWYCRRARQTFSLLPDFLASQVPGTLDEIEQAVVTAEAAATLTDAAQRLRPAEAARPVTLPSAERWLSRRRAWVTVVLPSVVTLLPMLSGSAPTVTAVRECLGTTHALRRVRDLGAVHLHSLPAPVGLCPRRRVKTRAANPLQHTMGPDPPTDRR